MFKKLIILLMLLTLIASGCTEKDTTTISNNDGNGDEWCPVGTIWQASNPKTQELSSMEIIGTETVDGVTMCKAVMETNTADEISKMEYLWAEDDETFTSRALFATTRLNALLEDKASKGAILEINKFGKDDWEIYSVGN